MSKARLILSACRTFSYRDLAQSDTQDVNFSSLLGDSFPVINEGAAVFLRKVSLKGHEVCDMASQGRRVSGILHRHQGSARPLCLRTSGGSSVCFGIVMSEDYV